MIKYISSAALFGAIALFLALTGCRDIEGVHYISSQHPANPEARSGKPAPMSHALVPENVTVKPKLEPATPANSSRSAPHQNHNMDHGMDHSMHRGSH